MAKGRAPRRRYEDEFKRKIVAEANAADVSVSEIARHHGLNANLVFNWRKKFGSGVAVAGFSEPQLLPVEIGAEETAGPAAALPSAPVLEIVLPCGSHLRCSSGMDPALLGHALVVLRPDTSGSVA
ncbi:IS66-like element accessory protein TnpA [Parasphingorhabdus sp.]|uniref:IS66-like element accessory protein TnpA n=1 Tax=Parasphingorhabdus sp. TaxID=2709688 RepID=UPI003D2660AB